MIITKKYIFEIEFAYLYLIYIKLENDNLCMNI